MNVYGVKPGRRAVMVGAGNIGLIISYQLRQAGVEVAAVVEAAPTIGGYAVHASKIRRLGIPILTSHSVKEAHGSRELEGVTVWKLDENQRGVEGTERRFEADVLCLAVGLSPLAELLWQAGCRMIYVPELGGHVPWRDEDQQTSVPGLYVAGDASGVEEASSAMLSGRIAGLAAAASLGLGPDRAEADGRELIDQARAELEALRRGPPGDKIRRGLARLEEAARAC
jgi:sarcosine oxidase subunit alpha